MQSYEHVNPYDMVQSVLFYIVAQSYEPVNPYDLVQPVIFFHTTHSHMDTLIHMIWSNWFFSHHSAVIWTS